MSNYSIQIQQIAAGIVQLKFPLPFRLDHINLYLLEDKTGWVLIDTGLNTSLSTELWSSFLDSDFFEKPIIKIIVTHLHPDHIGMSAWLSARLNVPVCISPGDWKMARYLWENDTELAYQVYQKYWAKLGLTGDKFQEMVSMRLHYKKLVKALPEKIEIISAPLILKIGKRDWEIIEGSGHSPQHLCLWNSSEKFLISGDHILPSITSNISLHPTGLNDPLSSYLKSLQQFDELDCACYLPAHGEISSNYHQRIKQLIDHHGEKCRKILDSMGESIDVFNATKILFDINLPSHQLMFAFGEAAAHLLYMVEQNNLERDPSNSWLFFNKEFHALKNITLQR